MPRMYSFFVSYTIFDMTNKHWRNIIKRTEIKIINNSIKQNFNYSLKRVLDEWTLPNFDYPLILIRMSELLITEASVTLDKSLTYIPLNYFLPANG